MAPHQNVDASIQFCNLPDWSFHIALRARLSGIVGAV